MLAHPRAWHRSVGANDQRGAVAVRLRPVQARGAIAELVELVDLHARRAEAEDVLVDDDAAIDLRELSDLIRATVRVAVVRARVVPRVRAVLDRAELVEVLGGETAVRDAAVQREAALLVDVVD